MGRDLTKIQCDPKNSQSINENLSYRVIHALGEMGVRHFCLAPGGRNTPLIDLLSEETHFKQYYFHDERSAGFFAIGKMMATGEPCAIVVTSGTAVGELLPSVMEAYYSRLPLIVVSADRPKRFRGTGAPQTAEQENIFGIYAPHFEDLDGEIPVRLKEWDKKTPCHLNLCLEEAYVTDYSRFPDLPLNAYETPSLQGNARAREETLTFLENTKHPIVVVGALSEEETVPVKKFLLKLKAPCILEGISRLRNDPDLKPYRLMNGDGALKKDYPIDGVLRIGGVPTTRLWRDTEYFEERGPLLSISSRPFSGSSWGALIHSELQFLGSVECSSKEWLLEDGKTAERLEALYKKYPMAEQTLVHRVSTLIPKDARVFLGNSLPIREWDMFSSVDSAYQDVHAVRGLNGIDGQISAFFGLLDEKKHTVGLIGDLTALYDMNAPFVLKDCAGTFTLIIINNGGGKIFQKLFKNPMIQNPHTIGFQHWPAIFGMSYRLVNTPDIILDSCVVEIVPSEAETLAFSKELMQ